MKKIRVVIVDDSAVMRGVLAEIVNREADMEAVGSAADPLIAREVIRSLNPDVITLDMEMPNMNGLDFLEKLMRLRPMPVVMVSALAHERFDAAVRARELGAAELVAKSRMNGPDGIEAFAAEITEKIRSAVARGTRTATAPPPKAAVPPVRPAADAPVRSVVRPAGAEKLIVIGASTGGTEAIKAVLERLPENAPGVLVTQHMPEGFTRSFAARLDSLCRVRVKEAEDGERVLPGHAYIAPGHSHLLVRRRGGIFTAELSQADPVNRHRPAVDVLFRSAAACGAAHMVGVILTGMGKDGAAGMRELHDAGAYTFAESEQTCVVFGMPKEAISLGGVDEVLPLNEIAGAVMARLALPVRASAQETTRCGR